MSRATVYATALGGYVLHINGKRVGDDYFSPGWSDFRRRVYYNAYDVTALLQAKANALGAVWRMAGTADISGRAATITAKSRG